MKTKTLLDKGYVTLVEHWGSDERIIESARMSTNKGFEGWEKDEKLLRYLYKNNHLTPFEMCGATFEIKAPIFVFREWHRHRTQSYNEMSARYIPLPDENYFPSMQDCLDRSHNAIKSHNRQAQGVPGKTKRLSTEADIGHWIWLLRMAYSYAQEAYDYALAAGLPKEMARITTPVGRYSKMRASANLRNWIQFLKLRQAANAQQEIRQYANAVCTLLVDVFPRTINLYLEE